MSIFGWFFDYFNTELEVANKPSMDINPANGLPMTNGIGSIDVAGNIYGTDSSYVTWSSNSNDFDSF